jgi:hypothetical protein
MSRSPLYWVYVIIGIILALILLWVLLRLFGAV